jgi:hypothetical protein
VRGQHQPGERALDALRFLVHLIASTLGVTVTAAVVAYSVVLTLHPIVPSIGSRTVHWILTETPYFPVQILVGSLLGFQLGHRYGHRVMLCTWFMPALGVALLVLFAPLPPVVVSGVEITKAAHFFGWACLPQNHWFEQVGFTLLLYAAIAYSMGAFLARVIRLSSRTEKPTDAIQTR